MWTLHKQQQHCGAQLHARSGKPRQAGEAPDEATRDRAAQEHDRAGDASLQPGEYPASRIENRRERAAGDAPVEWDDVVQPEPQLTELEQDERDDASKRERAIDLDDEEPGGERDAGEGPRG